MAVDKQALERAIHAALSGPEERNLKLEDYRFNVKPAAIERENGAIVVVGGEDGYISRRRRGRPNDRIFYEFEKRSAEINDLDIEIDRGGFKALISRGHLERVIKAAKVALEVFVIIQEQRRKSGETNMKADEAAGDAAFQETKRLLDGSWEGEASFLIANIALRVK